jgi:membrane protein CcdC involved in cytochrome C biogenesis
MRYAELGGILVENINIPTGNLLILFGSFATKSTDIVELSPIGSIFRYVLVKILFDVTRELISTVEEIMAQYFRCYC